MRLNFRHFVVLFFVFELSISDTGGLQHHPVYGKKNARRTAGSEASSQSIGFSYFLRVDSAALIPNEPSE